MVAFTLTVVAMPPCQAADLSPSKSIRIVNCDQKVQSRKRGVSANHLGPADFAVLATGVSWWYNWHHTTSDTKPKNVRMEFIPMAWGDRPEDLAGLEKYLAAGNRPRQILAINEPNLKDQAFISPERAANLYGRVNAIAQRYHIPVCAPQMSIGSAPDASIQAYDPLENKELTYTFMVPYLKAFFHFTAKARVSVPAVGIHPYTNTGGLKGLTELTYREFKRPVWVTEFNNSDESWDMEAIRTYMIQTVDFMERSPYVAGYAFFKERVKGRPKISLLADEPGKLTLLGEAYVSMPVHDADLYYRIPGRLQAENYVRMDKTEIESTTDADGFAQMTSLEPGALLAYNVQVDKAGTYTLQFRMTGEPGQVEVLKGDKVLASVPPSPNSNGWYTVTTNIPLSTGAQTLHIRLGSKGQVINWISFTKR